MKLKILFLYIITCFSTIATAKYKDFVITLPIIAMGGEAQAKFEYNLSGSGSLGVELLIVQEGEVFTEDEVAEQNGDSLMVKGSELALSYSSYSNVSKMSGGYWSLGLGYRQLQADWTRGPSEDFSPVGVSLDGDGKFKHELNSSGATAHARVGYRYVANSFPLAIGAYVGIRHYQNQFEDRESDTAISTPEVDQEGLSRRMMSALEPGVEVGMAF